MICSNVEEILHDMPELPAGIDWWIQQNCVIENYLIYDRECDLISCTRCGSEISLKKYEFNFGVIKHNHTGICPYCAGTTEEDDMIRKSVFKAYGKGRKKLTEYFRVLVPSKKDNVIYFALYEVEAEFTGWGTEIDKWLSAVYKVAEDELTYYKHSPADYYGRESWELRKKFKLAEAYKPMWSSRSKYEFDCIYPTDWDKLTEGTWLEKMQLKDWMKITDGNDRLLLGYIRECFKYPAMEKLFKGGLISIARERAAEITSEEINIRGNTLSKILKADMKTVRDCRENDYNMHQLSCYKKIFKKYGYRPKDITELRDAEAIRYRLELLPKFDLGRALKYIKEKKVGIYDFCDFVGQCWETYGKLKARYIFPKDFNAEHEKLSKLITYKKDKDLEERMTAAIEKAGVNGNIYEIDNLLFVLGKTPQELADEGTAQHHCVAGYSERVANGKSVIWFIRKKEDPAHAYYTLELDPDGELVQCRGLKNCAMTQEVEIAVAKFCELYKKERKSA